MKSMRKSGIKLKALREGHGDLNLLILELTELKTVAKQLLKSQQTATNYQLKWAQDECSKAEQDIAAQAEVLSSLWREVQDTFVDQVRQVRECFQSILDTEKQLDDSQDQLKQLLSKQKSAVKKRNVDSEVRQLDIRVSEAKTKVFSCKSTCSITKLTEFKKALIISSDAYIDLSSKMGIVFEAQRALAEQLPSPGEYLETMTYHGSANTERIVQSARLRLKERTDALNRQRRAASLSAAESQQLSCGYFQNNSSFGPPLPPGPTASWSPQSCYPLGSAPPAPPPYPVEDHRSASYPHPGGPMTGPLRHGRFSGNSLGRQNRNRHHSRSELDQHASDWCLKGPNSSQINLYIPKGRILIGNSGNTNRHSTYI